MSSLGPLQKLTATLVASGALMRSSTRPVESTLGNSAPGTLVVADWKPVSCAAHTLAASNNTIANLFIVIPLKMLGAEPAIVFRTGLQ